MHRPGADKSVSMIHTMFHVLPYAQLVTAGRSPSPQLDPAFLFLSTC